MSCLSLLQGPFATQGSNLGVLHCREILYPLSHQGSPLSKDSQIIFRPFFFCFFFFHSNPAGTVGLNFISTQSAGIRGIQCLDLYTKRERYWETRCREMQKKLTLVLALWTSLMAKVEKFGQGGMETSSVWKYSPQAGTWAHMAGTETHLAGTWIQPKSCLGPEAWSFI